MHYIIANKCNHAGSITKNKAFIKIVSIHFGSNPTCYTTDNGSTYHLSSKTLADIITGILGEASRYHAG